MEEKRKAHTDLWAWMKRKEMYWAQNSKISWLKDGDRNTKFFHIIASNKRRKNSIASIEVNGVCNDDIEKIKKEASNFFKNIFKEEYHNRPTFDGLEFKALSPEQAASLILPFLNDEIDNAISSCDSDKASGPDGFNFKFVKKAWGTIKHDIYTRLFENSTNTLFSPEGATQHT